MKKISPPLSRFLLRFIIGLFFASFGMYFSHRLYFGARPFFGYTFLAEFIIGLLMTVFAVLFLPTIVVTFWTNLVSNLSNLISRTVFSALVDFRKQRIQGEQRRSKERFSRAVILDTSAIIDGRILGVISHGFLDAPVVVPQFVIDELQKIADSEQDLKRQKGRRGLEVLEKIKKVSQNKFKIWPLREVEDVDHSLVDLAKQLRGKIATVDFNLNKAASVGGVKVLNVNDLANSLKTAVLPGDILPVKVLQQGKEVGQGVGYLSDGTMVVVEDSSNLIGKEIAVKISRVIQTSAGQMLFANPIR